MAEDSFARVERKVKEFMQIVRRAATRLRWLLQYLKLLELKRDVVVGESETATLFFDVEKHILYAKHKKSEARKEVTVEHAVVSYAIALDVTGLEAQLRELRESVATPLGTLEEPPSPSPQG